MKWLYFLWKVRNYAISRNSVRNVTNAIDDNNTRIYEMIEMCAFSPYLPHGSCKEQWMRRWGEEMSWSCRMGMKLWRWILESLKKDATDMKLMSDEYCSNVANFSYDCRFFGEIQKSTKNTKKNCWKNWKDNNRISKMLNCARVTQCENYPAAANTRLTHIHIDIHIHIHASSQYEG